MTNSLKEGGKPPRTRNIVGDRYTTYGHRSESDDALGGIVALGYIILFVAFIAVLAYLANTLPHLFTTLDRNVENKYLLALIGGLGSLLVGVSLYYFRERKRMQYALLEIAFGLVTGGVAILRVNTQGDLGVWVALSAAAYLVVRGMDNLQKARELSRTNKTEPNNSFDPTPR